LTRTLALLALLASTGAPAEARTVAQVLKEVGPAARARLRPYFGSTRYPPARVTFAAFKRERRFEIWAHDGRGKMRCVREYPIVGASGSLGPKLRRGDLQVPEGLYRATWLNPNSAGYLGIKLDYPNALDRQAAKSDGRTDLGGDIYIHGHWYSTGCLAMGDETVEDLFVLAADTGLRHVRVLIVPADLRSPTAPAGRAWVGDLYDQLRRDLSVLR